MNGIRILPPGYTPQTVYQCSQRGDVWTDITASSAGQAAINQARMWMAMGYRLPMTIAVRQKGLPDTVHRYRVATSEIAATLVESNSEEVEISRAFS